jgi:hypothetical protein
VAINPEVRSVIVCVRVKPAIKALLQSLAVERDGPLSELVSDILEAHLDHPKK